MGTFLLVSLLVFCSMHFGASLPNPNSGLANGNGNGLVYLYVFSVFAITIEFKFSTGTLGSIKIKLYQIF